MKKLFLFLPLAGLLLFSCSKDDDNNNVAPVVTSIEARYEVNLSSTEFQTDSIVGTYLKKDGTLGSLKSTTGTWTSPTMTYKQGDSVYAQIYFYGKKLSITALGPNIYLVKPATKGIVSGTASSSRMAGTSVPYSYTSTVTGKVSLQ